MDTKMKKISHKKAQNSQIGIFCEFCAFLWLILFFVAALCFAQQQSPPPQAVQGLKDFTSAQNYAPGNVINPQPSIGAFAH